MASTVQDHQPPSDNPAPNEAAVAEPNADTAASKRAIDGDDEILFVSSNPVKRFRVAQGEPPVSMPVANQVLVPVAVATRSPSNIAAPTVPLAPVPDMSPDAPTGPAPILENFAFPSPAARLVPADARRVSEAISPKQLPQTISPMLLHTKVHPPTLTRPEQISCLDFNSAVTIPGLDLGNIFQENTPTTKHLFAAGPGTQNPIPFTVYSMGNLMPMQVHQQSQSGPQQLPPTLGGTTQKLVASEGARVAQGSHPPGHRIPNLISTQPRQGSPLRYTHGPGFYHGQSYQPFPTPALRIPSGVPVAPGIAGVTVSAPGTPHSHRQPAMISTNQQSIVAQQQPLVGHQPLQSQQQQQSQQSQQPRPPQTGKHAQDLFVDIAETVERTFPYAEVAVRHGVTPSRVAEALSGVVMLPLVRCASDKRRTGRLAQDRMREYREAKQMRQSHSQDQIQGEGQMSAEEMVRFFEGEGQSKRQNT